VRLRTVAELWVRDLHFVQKGDEQAAEKRSPKGEGKREKREIALFSAFSLLPSPVQAGLFISLPGAPFRRSRSAPGMTGGAAENLLPCRL
jgi:hypothetical protein